MASRGGPEDSTARDADGGFDLTAIGAGLSFTESLGDLERALSAGPTVVVQAPPGTGKTTLVPPLVSRHVRGRVLVTQPRRVAVRAAARRLAQLDGSRVGDRVGHAVRGERKTSPRTLVEFVTPGLLLRRLLSDPELSGVGAVVVDEVHERQLDTDLLLGLLGDVRELRDDLRLVAMSATLDAARFAELLSTDGSAAPVVDSPSSLHPLSVHWRPGTGPRTDARGVGRDFLDHVARVTAQAHRAAVALDPSHDALVFLPGVPEVDHVVQRLGELAPEVEVLALHGRASAAEQDRAVAGRGPGDAPRIVVSTALAESSLTVPGVRLVVDSGLSREPRRDAARQMSGLVTVTSSRATSEQRAGRAARQGPGTVVRCFDERTFAAAPAQATPEVHTADLTGATLLLAVWGTPRASGLRLPDAPSAASLDEAEQVLRSLGALNDEGRATALGERLAQVPVEPRWAAALMGAAAAGAAARDVARAVATAAGDLRPRGADLSGLVRSLADGRHPQAVTWRREVDRLTRLVPAEERAPTRSHPRAGADVLARVVATAWPDRVARRVEDRTYLLARGTRAALPPDSPLAGTEWLAVADVARAEGRAAGGTGAVIRSAVELSEEQALELAGAALVREDVADLSGGKMSGRRVQRLGAIELSATPVRLDPEHAQAAVAAALRTRGLDLFDWSGPAEELRRRLAFLHAHRGVPWPAMDDAALMARWQEWLTPEVDRIARGTPLGRIDLTDAVRRLLPWPAASELDTLAPARLRVPSGNTAAVRYPEVGDPGPPVVEVKLQECFGLAESPRLAGVRVLFHLLSPAGRPLALTDDLASFWSGPYAGVRAEMRGRYPKHPWPEDPWSATATHLTTRRARG